MNDIALTRVPAPAGRLPEPPLLIPDTEASRLAGVSRATWHRLRAAGKVPAAVRLGRAVRWRRQEVEDWIEAGCPDARTWGAMQASAARLLARL